VLSWRTGIEPVRRLRKTECERSRRRIFDLEQRALAPPKIVQRVSERAIASLKWSQNATATREILASNDVRTLIANQLGVDPLVKG
jgi:hypothetical protein